MNELDFELSNHEDGGMGMGVGQEGMERIKQRIRNLLSALLSSVIFLNPATLRPPGCQTAHVLLSGHQQRKCPAIIMNHATAIFCVQPLDFEVKIGFFSKHCSTLSKAPCLPPYLQRTSSLQT